jgi:hypothetical protein
MLTQQTIVNSKPINFYGLRRAINQSRSPDQWSIDIQIARKITRQKMKSGKSRCSPSKKSETEPIGESSSNASPLKQKKSRNGENQAKFKSWQVTNSESIKDFKLRTDTDHIIVFDTQ